MYKKIKDMEAKLIGYVCEYRDENQKRRSVLFTATSFNKACKLIQQWKSKKITIVAIREV